MLKNMFLKIDKEKRENTYKIIQYFEIYKSEEKENALFNQHFSTF